MGVSVLGPPLLCPWGRGKEICGVLSPLIMASLLHDQDKGPIHSPLDSPRGGGPKTFWVSFPPGKRGGKNTGVSCELPSC